MACRDPGSTTSEEPVDYRSPSQAAGKGGQSWGGQCRGGCGARQGPDAWEQRDESQATVQRWLCREHQRVTHRPPHSGTHTALRRGLHAPPCPDTRYLLALDPRGSGWADLPGKARGPLGKTRKTCGRTFQPGRVACCQRGVCGGWFMEINYFQTFHPFCEGKSMGFPLCEADEH